MRGQGSGIRKFIEKKEKEFRRFFLF